MFKLFSLFSSRYRRRWLYGFFSLILVLSLGLTNIKPTYGVSVIELILRGAQFVPQIIQFSTINDKQEVALGTEINKQLAGSGKVKLYRDPAINSYINEIGQRLVKTSQRPNIPYTFQIVADKNINAFATMGGYVYVNSGLITTAENEAELASVIGHEIGHIVGRHAIEHMRQQAISQGVLSAAGLGRNQAVQIGVELALSRPNSRKDELEADQFGLANLTKAGYAPGGMVSFMNKLLQKSGGAPPSFLSTHPATSERIQALKQSIPRGTEDRGQGLDNRAYQNRIRSLS
jgi:beta-barrel assembly-enhancing protease